MNTSILTTAILSLASFGAMAQLTPGTDILSVASLTESGVTLGTDPSPAGVTYTSPTTGTPYSITNVCDKDGSLYFNMGLGFRNTESAGYLKEIRLTGLEGIGFTVYAASEPISTSPFSQPGVATLDVDRSTGLVTIDAPYRYVGVWTYEAGVKSVEIEWSAEAPEVAAAKPYIVLNSELGCPTGSTVTIDSDTKSAEIEVKVSRNGEVILSETKPNPATVVLEGEVGDKLTVEARAVGEGYTPSDWMKRTYTITDPILAAPEFSLSSYSSVVTLGSEVTISNPNAEGSVMKYSVCGGEEVSTSEASVTVIAEGEVGAEWTISAYCSAEGWIDSEVNEWEGTIATNVCPAPTFTPAPGEYPAGTSIKISATYPASSVTYRVNGGEWETSTSLWNLSVTLTDDMTIEAYSSAAAPYVDSETVTGVFSIEKLGADCDEITCSTFGEVATMDFATYTSPKSSNGAVYSLLGRDMSDAMFINGSGYLRTVEGDRAISRIKVDARFGNALVLYLSEAEIEGRNSASTSMTLTQEDFGQWIEIPAALTPAYFYLTTEEETLANCLDRVVVDYGISSGIDSIAAECGETQWFDLMGNRVQSPSKGLYICVKGRKAFKIIVK